MENEIDRGVKVVMMRTPTKEKIRFALRASDWASDLFWPLVAVRHSYQSLDIFGIGTH